MKKPLSRFIPVKILEFEEIPVFQVGWMNGHGAALPPWCILVGDDFNHNLLRHEFGHFLQYRKTGFWKFYFNIGAPSLLNLIGLGIEKLIFKTNRFIKAHEELRVEKEANNLSRTYFGIKENQRPWK